MGLRMKFCWSSFRSCWARGSASLRREPRHAHSSSSARKRWHRASSSTPTGPTDLCGPAPWAHRRKPTSVMSVEGNPVNDGVVFWIRAGAYDLAVKILSDAPAGGILYCYRIDEAVFAKSCVSPLNKCGHDFPAKTLPVRAL